MQTIAVHLAASTVILLLGGCVFDRTGVDARDAALLDRASDRADLPAAEQAPPPNPCAKPTTDNVCRFESISDTVGQSGTCNGDQFEADSPFARHCFAEARCVGGTCRPVCTTVCLQSTCSEGEVCAGLFLGATVKSCCVRPTPHNGNKVASDGCSANSECQSGLCIKRGNCFQPCVASANDCPASMVCGQVTIQEGSKQAIVQGCLFKPDAGPPDGSPDVGLDVAVPDVAVPDVAVPDVAVPDVAVPDVAAPIDAPIPDALIPDAAPADLGLADQPIEI